MRGQRHGLRAGALLLRLGLLLCLVALNACQGTSTGNGGPRPRSREESGTNANLPYETLTSNRKPIDDTGGELEYQGAKLTIPRGAVDEPVFFEVSVAEDAPDGDVLPGSVYQLNPNTLELRKDGLLTIGYSDADIKPGQNEEHLVIVHKVSNIWTELSNSKVYIHDNLVEAPIRFLGLYGLRLASEDPRMANAMPVAEFEFSDEAYPDQHGENAAAAEKRAVDEAAAASEAGKTEPGATPPAEGGAATPGGNAGGGATTPATPTPGTGSSATGPVEQPKTTSSVIRSFVGGPNSDAPKPAPPKPVKTKPVKKKTPPPVKRTPTSVKASSRKQSSQAADKPVAVAPDKPAAVSASGASTATGPVQQTASATGPASSAPLTADDELRRRREQDQLSAAGGTGGSTPAAGTGATGSEPDTTQTSIAEGAAPPFTPKPGQVGEIKGEGVDVTVYFNASASSDPDGRIVQYDWDWDADGVFDYTSHSSPYAEHTFRHNGDYSVVLKVTDNGRYAQAGYAVGTVEVRSAKAPPLPAAANISAFPSFGPAPLTVHLAATITGGTAPYVYKWTFNDGSESNLPNPFTTYPTPGVYTIRFIATDIKGVQLTGNLNVEVQDRHTPGTPQPRMELDITPSVDRGQAPFEANFKLSPLRATGPVTYRISYGDEEPGADETVTTNGTLEHIYTNAGFYIVKVVATDADLRTASTFATVNAYAAADARGFTASSNSFSGDAFSFGHSMRIVYEYTDASKRTLRLHAAATPKPAEQLAYTWDFGDGTFSTKPGPDHTFAKDGVYEIRLSAADGTQRWRQRIWLPISQKTSAVAIQRPALVDGPAPLTLAFDAIVTRGEEPLRYDWTFGETRRSDASPRFTFDKPGDYDVNLTVKDKYSTTFTAPKVTVRVRATPPDYRLPLAVIEPVTGSTRATVVDYTGASPLPVSNPKIDGGAKLVDLSVDGQYVAIVTDDGLIVKRVRDAAPQLSFLPATGAISAVRVVTAAAGPVAIATITGGSGTATWMLRGGSDPVRIGDGVLVAVAGDGGQVILAPKLNSHAVALTRYPTDPESGQIGVGADFGQASEVALSRDGGTAYYLASDNRLVRRNVRTSEEFSLSTGKDAKHGLVCSADGWAAAFAIKDGKTDNIIYGHSSPEGEFRLVSVTDKLGWGSGYLRLSADGQYLLSYGSRGALATLLGKAGKADKKDKDGKSPVDGEDSAGAPAPLPGAPQHDRFGIVRLDLHLPPDQWTISSVNPRFVYECEADFAAAGPFD